MWATSRFRIGLGKGRTRRSRVRLLVGATMLVAAVLISGLVLGDVILTYAVTTSLGNSASTPFWFDNGANYAAANTLTFVTITCTGSTPTSAGLGGTNCGAAAQPTPSSAETVTISGVNAVNTYLIAMSQFMESANFPATGTVTLDAAQGVVSTVTPWTATTCAYAFLTTVQPAINPSTLSATGPSGQAAGCNVFEPVETTGYMEDLNLLTGLAANPNQATTCAGQAGVTYVGGGGACATTFGPATGKTGAAPVVLLYLSFAIVVTSATPTGSTAVEINPVVS